MEILGGLGLVLPGMPRIRTGLTPLAAAGLSIIMTGAAVVTIQTMGSAPAALPFVTGVLARALAAGAAGRAGNGSPAGQAFLISNCSTCFSESRRSRGLDPPKPALHSPFPEGRRFDL
jgi:hypothetical protein